MAGLSRKLLLLNLGYGSPSSASLEEFCRLPKLSSLVERRLCASSGSFPGS